VTLHLLYRLYPVESLKRRPPYHSKTRCLRSATESLAQVEGARLVLLVDADHLPVEFSEVIPQGLTVERVMLGGIGNARSYERQMDLVRSLPPEDLVYLSEDDYLYCPEAFVTLVAAAAALRGQVDYFSLYDHPDRYVRDDDAPLKARRPVWLAGDRHWRWAESTCMTFGARVETILADARLHARFSPRGTYRENPVSRWRHLNDRRLWRALQGLGPVPRPNARRLASPIPSLSTHMDEAFLAPAVDWRSVAEALDAS